jgi:DGQHR domain-containing protein
MENTNPFIEIDCLEVIQPIGTFYIGVIDSRDLCKISFADIREIDRELDNYLGIERKLSPNRVIELQKYVQTIDATFPTSVILAMDSKDAKYDPKSKRMQIRNNIEVAKIIDGQHRIKGLSTYKGDNFKINISMFVDMDIEDQAMVFATINLAQTKVNKSLVYDLYDYAEHRSPQKTCHNIARLLNSKEVSPFKDRIKILGTADPMVLGLQLITQATFVESLLILISGSFEKAYEDRELLKENKRLSKPTDDVLRDVIFRNLFIEEKDAEIAMNIWNYFEAISIKWNTAWNDIKTKGNILPRTNGFRAFMRFLPSVYWALGGPDKLYTKNEYYSIIKNIKILDNEFTSDIYKPGTSGEKLLFDNLCKNL